MNTGNEMIIKSRRNFKNDKKPDKIRKIETNSEIIIKQRIKYVKGKGWLIKVTRIMKPTQRNNRKSKKQSSKPKKKNERKKFKQKGNSKPKSKVKNKKANEKIKNSSTISKDNIKTAVPISKSDIKSTEYCKPEPVAYVNDKGWLYKVKPECIKNKFKKKNKL